MWTKMPWKFGKDPLNGFLQKIPKNHLIPSVLNRVASLISEENTNILEINNNYKIGAILGIKVVYSWL